MNLRRRLEDLERRPAQPGRGSPEARRRMGDLLDRYASAKRSGTLTDGLRGEMESAVSALRARLGRGEGGR